ncbi:alpha/beta fold hydrolase [Pseudarthrobacter sp. NPDC058196]|uniref:alpha/beta fold hydrolase n=1 Tax=Pseudarthrobacter sp. NPDC058196 TaxID=3346376 RepID=UPI0036DA989B
MSKTTAETGQLAPTTLPERHVQTGGFKTRFLEAGDPQADIVLLLHDGAWGGSSDVSWSRCLPLLAQRYRVLAPDFLGFGGSDKATFFDRSPYQPRITQLEDLMEVLGISVPVHIVGTSFGGSVALRLLVEGNLPIRSVTSIGGSGGHGKTEIMKEQLGRWDGSRADLARILRFLTEEDDHFERQLAARFKAASTPGHYRAVASAAMSIPASMRNTIEPDRWPDALQRSDVPTLLIAGLHDQLFDPEWPDRIADVIAHATIKRIDSLHSPNLDRPHEIAELVLQHLQTAERASTFFNVIRSENRVEEPEVLRPNQYAQAKS